MRKLFGGKALAVAAVVGGAVLASVAPVMAEVSADSPSRLAVRLESPAKWRAWGAAIDVRVTYSCPAGEKAGLNVNVTQSVLGGVASGSGVLYEANCTGGFETATLTVTAQDHAFRWGTAYGRFSLNQLYDNVGDERDFRIAP